MNNIKRLMLTQQFPFYAGKIRTTSTIYKYAFKCIKGNYKYELHISEE